MDDCSKEMNLLSRWQSLGRLINPEKHIPWAVSHASLPVPMIIDEKHIRVFFSSRNKQKKSSIGFVDIELFNNKVKVISISEKPFIEFGRLGEFDGDGIYLSSLVRTESIDHLYTIGWNQGFPQPMFYASIGYAQGSLTTPILTKRYNYPIITRDKNNPYLVTSPVVLKEKKKWKMWYVSGYKWEEINHIPQSYYTIKYAESSDGISWNFRTKPCIDPRNEKEANISRFWVKNINGFYHAWFASHDVHDEYNIQYAVSEDGFNWERKGSVKLNDCDSEWCKNSQAYPAVINHNGSYYMFYNGNGFGRTGIGIAVCTN